METFDPMPRYTVTFLNYIMEKIALTLVTGYLLNLLLVELFDVRSYSGLVATVTVIVTIILCIEFDRKVKMMEARIRGLEDRSINLDVES